MAYSGQHLSCYIIPVLSPPQAGSENRSGPFLGRRVKKTWLDIVALAVLAGVPVATLYIYPAITSVVLPLCIAAGVVYISQTRWR
jgi:hypothetical protein